MEDVPESATLPFGGGEGQEELLGSSSCGVLCAGRHLATLQPSVNAHNEGEALGSPSPSERDICEEGQANIEDNNSVMENEDPGLLIQDDLRSLL